MASNYDLSDLGGKMVADNASANYDLSDLGGTPMTDAATSGQLQPAPAMPPASRNADNLLLRATGDIAAGLANSGQGVHNFLSRALKPVLGQYAPAETNIDFGKLFGVNDPNLADRLTQGAAQQLPYMPIGAESAIGRIGSNFLFGATQSNDPIKGADLATEVGLATELLPPMLGTVGKGIYQAGAKIAGKFNPKNYADKIMDVLSNGRSLEDNGKSIAQDIQAGYQMQKAEASKLYNPVHEAVGNKRIYAAEFNPAESSYHNLADDITQSYTPSLRKLHQDFLKNPTFENAHELRSQLGSTMRKLQKNPTPDIATTNAVDSFSLAQNAIDTDMHNFLQRTDPALSDQYSQAAQYFAENVAPYRENTKLAKIAAGDVTNPKNIASLFAHPEDEITKVLGDMPEDINHRILYAELGKGKTRLNGEKLLNSINDLDKKGLGSYITPELEAHKDKLAQKVAMKKLASTVGGALTGGLIGGHSSLPFGEAIGAGIGAATSPITSALATRAWIPDFIKKMPSPPPSVKEALSTGYGIGSRAAIADAINRGNQ